MILGKLYINLLFLRMVSNNLLSLKLIVQGFTIMQMCMKLNKNKLSTGKNSLNSENVQLAKYEPGLL